ncbi:intelectin-like [Neoarius graeffei]|uniref:intelectin-like n=1 Tax=Neoarius graeffei TaxID=443677 RepID=UPI00298CD865|nr:intelectin-like [Neoarius graeffei]
MPTSSRPATPLRQLPQPQVSQQKVFDYPVDANGQVDLGFGVSVNASNLQYVSRVDLRKTTYTICEAVFSRNELANCSVTGKKSNAFKDQTERPMLDENKVSAVIRDRWSSQQGGSPQVPEGDGSWSNTVTFGTAEAATSDDFKNPGYYDIAAEDVAVWHVPNNERVDHWKPTSFLRYHTENRFLKNYGGNFYNLFKRFTVKYNVRSCPANHGPAVPVVYDVGDTKSNLNLYGPLSRGYSEPGFITFRAINTERAATAICSGLKPKACHTEHFCIEEGGYFPEESPRQCGDFTAFDWVGYGTHTGSSASKQVTEAAVLIFYR